MVSEFTKRNQSFPRSSEIIAKALKMEPMGVPSKTARVCAFCGASIKVGDLYSGAKFSDFFMDDLSLAARGSTSVCGWCQPTLTSAGLIATQGGIFSPTSCVAGRSWNIWGEALTNPPEPPFVMIFATAKNQHMAWRAPVNWSRDMFHARVGLRDLRIRRPVLLEAVQACIRLGEAQERVLSALEKKSGKPRKAKPPRKPPSDPTEKKRVRYANPYVSLTADLKNSAHGKIKPSYSGLDWSNEPEAKKDLEFLRTLPLGETWGLCFCLTHDA